MGVDIGVWRARIGVFIHRGGFSQIDKIEGYNGEVRWTAGADLTYRLVVTMSAILIVLTGVLAVNCFSKACVTLMCDIGVETYTVKSIHETDPAIPQAISISAIGCTDFIHANRHNRRIIGQLLLISGVESNPGPPKLDPLDAMKKELIAEIRQVRSDVSKEVKDIKQEMRGIKSKCTELESTCREIREQFSDLSQKVINMEEEISEVREKEHVNNLDVEELARRLDDIEQRMDDTHMYDPDKYVRLEEEIDRLEEYSRRDNLIFYGIPEVTDETYSMCRSTVLQILQKTVKTRLWSERDIVNAHRLGAYSANRDRPRPMIVKFFHWQDKKLVFADKQSVADEGYKVSGDLTWRKRQKLRELNAEGKSGYFRRGQLVIVDSTRVNSGTRGRGQGRGSGRGATGGVTNHSALRRTRSQSLTPGGGSDAY